MPGAAAGDRTPAPDNWRSTSDSLSFEAASGARLMSVSVRNSQPGITFSSKPPPVSWNTLTYFA